jgi:hypothetical protein
MVIGERFAWGHLQKTGGDATLLMFQILPRLIVRADPRNDQAKHAPFAERGEETAGKLLVCNIRRLPQWSLSWAQHRVQRAGEAMSSPQRIAEAPRADRRLAVFTDEGRLTIDRWLRTERLAEDFIDFASELTDLTDEERQSVTNHPPVNELEYDHRIEHWFAPDQVRLMYDGNPVWAAIEESVYGDLALLD